MCTHAQEVHDGMTIQGQMGAVGNSAPFMQWNKKVLGNIKYGCWKSPMQRGGSWESLGLIEATSSIDEDEQGVGVVAYMGGNKDDIFKKRENISISICGPFIAIATALPQPPLLTFGNHCVLYLYNFAKCHIFSLNIIPWKFI